MVRILVDSSADFSKEELEAKNLLMVPLTITINNTDNYKDVLELERAELYRLLTTDNTRVMTSQPSPQDFLEKFQEVKDAGDEVVCILLSSGLSGTYQSACLAKEMVDYDKIYLVDSLTATVAIRILTDYALQLVEEGRSAAEIAEIMEQMKSKLEIRAVVDTLKFLYLGGRVSRTTAIVGDAVTIKPAILVSRDGLVEVCNKYLGVRRAVKDLTAQFVKADVNRNFPVYMVYSQTDDNAQLLKKALNDAGETVDGAYEIGATIGVHTGPGVFGVIYVAN